MKTKSVRLVVATFTDGLAEYKRMEKEKYLWTVDEKLDPKCNEYKGMKIGTIAHRENMFEFNDYDQVMVVGFTVPLLVNNEFANAEARAGKFRRVIIAYRYKGKLEVNSHPPKSIHATPVVKKIPLCKCGKPVDPLMGGTCGRINKCKTARGRYLQYVS